MAHQITDEQAREEALFAAHLTTQVGVDEPTAIRDIRRRYGYDEESARVVLRSGRALLQNLDAEPSPCVGQRIWKIETETVAHLAAALHHARQAASSCTDHEVSRYVTDNAQMIRTQLDVVEFLANGDEAPASVAEQPVVEFDPPRYTWQAANVREARSVLGAAEDLLNSHMASLAPGDRTYVRSEAEEETSASIRISLDLTGIVAQINAKSAPRDGG